MTSCITGIYVLFAEKLRAEDRIFIKGFAMRTALIADIKELFIDMENEKRMPKSIGMSAYTAI